MTFEPKVYKDDSGDRLVVASGGVLNVASGGELQFAGTDRATALNLVVAGVAAGYKIARGTLTPTQDDETVVTGLSTVVAAVASLKGDPTVTHMWSGVNIGDQAGSPAAGSIIIWSKKPTATNDVTPVAATTPWSAVDWVAIGT